LPRTGGVHHRGTEGTEKRRFKDTYAAFSLCPLCLCGDTPLASLDGFELLVDFRLEIDGEGQMTALRAGIHLDEALFLVI
jgi:hypothetical protein